MISINTHAGMFAYLATVNNSTAFRAHSFPKLAFCQMLLPFRKDASPGTRSLVELALDYKFGHLLPHELVRIVVLKRRQRRGRIIGRHEAYPCKCKWNWIWGCSAAWSTNTMGCFHIYLAAVNCSSTIRTNSFPKLAFCQMSLPLRKEASPGTVSLVELAFDNKFGHLLPHELVRIVVLKRGQRREGSLIIVM